MLARFLSTSVILTVEKLEANSWVIKIILEEKCFIREKFNHIARECSDKEKNNNDYFNVKI